MVRTRNAEKRHKVATVELALFNPDVVCLLSALLDAQDLCQMSLTCKALGGKRADSHNGLSLVEEAARQLFECATEWERSCLPKYEGEGWIELYHHLLMLRSKLTFDQLVGANIQYGEDQSSFRASSNWNTFALCSNHVMRSGRHFATFTVIASEFVTAMAGVIRPVQIDRSDLGDSLEGFSPILPEFGGYLRGTRTDRWTDSNVHCCAVTAHCLFGGRFIWSDWANSRLLRGINGFQLDIPIGLLLDLDEGTLTLYQNGQRLTTLQNGQRLTTLKDGLSGEYCWFGTGNYTISIQRGLAPST